MSEMKRGPGRPPKAPFERRRHIQTFRVRDLTRERMEAAAEADQCSISEWVEQLVEAHFAGQDQRAIIREEIRAALAEHEAAKRERLMRAVTVGPNGAYGAGNIRTVQTTTSASTV